MDADDRRAVAEELVYLERYEQLRPKDPFAAAWRAGLYVELHRFDEARELLLGCAERLNASKEGRQVWTRGWAAMLHARGELIEEERHRRLLTALEPNYTFDWIYLGVCLSCQGRLHDARDAYRRATQCEGDPDEAWLNVGLISRALGEFEIARHAAAQALALCPEYPAAERLLADVSTALALLDKVTSD